jgi:predicted Zn-dependent protease
MFRLGRTIFDSLRRRPGRSGLVLALLVLLGAVGFVASPQVRAQYHWRAAQQANEQHRLSSAQDNINQCLRFWPRSADVHFLAARIARRSGAHGDAERYLDECEHLQGGRTDQTGLERILLQVQQGDLSPETERYLYGYVERDAPESPLVLEALARGYLEMLNLPAALTCLGQCLQKQPDDIPALFLRGRVRERMSNIDAMADYRRVLELEPGHDEARLRLAETLFTFGRADEALAQFELLQQHRPDDPAVRLGLAGCRYHAGRLDEAHQLLDALLAADPRNLGALKEQGRLELEAGRGSEAERWLRQALDLDQADRETHHLLTQALRQQGKEEPARAQQEEADRVLADLTRLGVILNVEMSARPRDPALCCELGTLYMRYGKREQGIRWLQRALQCDPHYQPARQALAESGTPD